MEDEQKMIKNLYVLVIGYGWYRWIESWISPCHLKHVAKKEKKVLFDRTVTWNSLKDDEVVFLLIYWYILLRNILLCVCVCVCVCMCTHVVCVCVGVSYIHVRAHACGLCGCGCACVWVLCACITLSRLWYLLFGLALNLGLPFWQQTKSWYWSSLECDRNEKWFYGRLQVLYSSAPMKWLNMHSAEQPMTDGYQWVTWQLLLSEKWWAVLCNIKRLTLLRAASANKITWHLIQRYATADSHSPVSNLVFYAQSTIAVISGQIPFTRLGCVSVVQ